MKNTHKKSDAVESFLMLFVDLLCVILSYLIAIGIKFHNASYVDYENLHKLVCIGILLFCAIYNSMFEMNRNFVRRGYLEEFFVILKRNAMIGILMIFLLFLVKEAENYSRLVFGYFLVVNQVLTYLIHALIKKYLRTHMSKDKNRKKVMVISETAEAEKLLSRMKEKADLNIELSYLVLWDEQTHGAESVQGVEVVGNKSNYQEIAKQIPLDEVFLYLPEVGRSEIQEIIQYFEIMGVACHYSIDTPGMSPYVHTVADFAGYSVITYEENYIDDKHLFAKRLMDIVGSLIGLLFTGILFPFVALAIKLDSPGPVTFAQTRIGKNGRRFKVYKFRSMYVDAEERKKELMAQNQVKGLMFKMEDDPRITRVGRFIRKTSIDELPQFYNILIGDMSLVGTRPPTVDEFEQYTPYYRKRLSMTPGLTGLWQVSGRSDIDDFDDVVKLDIAYIDNWSLKLDLKILFKTVYVVLFSKGAK